MFLRKKNFVSEKKNVRLKKTSFEILSSKVWKGGFQLMLILVLLGMYFDAAMVLVKTFLLLHRLALAILCTAKTSINHKLAVLTSSLSSFWLLQFLQLVKQYYIPFHLHEFSLACFEFSDSRTFFWLKLSSPKYS